MQFYDGNKVLNTKDINGDKPEIFIVEGVRSAGKTTYFNHKLLKDFETKKIRKFALLYRYAYEVTDAADKFFKDLHALWYPQSEFTQSTAKPEFGFIELFFNGVPCGYALALNKADQIKKYSHFLSDIDEILFDEFQSETNHYCSDEITKFMSIHTSIARGNGQQSRYLPVYMLSNAVSLLNPYYTTLGVTNRLRLETRFLRGEGWVLQRDFNESAIKAQETSLFNKAFKDTRYLTMAKQGIYLNDNIAFIETPKSRSQYLCTLKYKGKMYGVKSFPEEGIVFCDTKFDSTFRTKLAVTTDDHNINYVVLKQNSVFIQALRYYFEYGCIRFKNLEAKEALLTAIAYY